MAWHDFESAGRPFETSRGTKSIPQSLSLSGIVLARESSKILFKIWSDHDRAATPALSCLVSPVGTETKRFSQQQTRGEWSYVHNCVQYAPNGRPCAAKKLNKRKGKSVGCVEAIKLKARCSGPTVSRINAYLREVARLLNLFLVYLDNPDCVSHIVKIKDLLNQKTSP